MSEAIDRARRAWAETGLDEGLGADLIRRWTEPHRRYHDLSHLLATLRALPLLLAGRPEERHAGRIERLALWFHDAVHAGSPGTDEAASAVLARRELAGVGVSEHDADEVARLVLVTAHHSPAADDPLGRRVSDADLWILGSPPLHYRDSVAALREEHAHLDEDQWRRGRMVRVTQLLALPTLFHTPRGSALREAPARGNLAAELRALTLRSRPDGAERRPGAEVGS